MHIKLIPSDDRQLPIEQPMVSFKTRSQLQQPIKIFASFLIVLPQYMTKVFVARR